MIELQGVTKGFRGFPVLRDMSFTVATGEIVGLLGPNGSGKTTTIRLINGVIHADGGRITVGGRDPVTAGDAIRRQSGVLTESATLYAELSGLDNLRFFARLYGVTDPHRPAALLAEFGLGEHQHRKVGTYSTGMKKRLGLAKALLNDPGVLFLDEPTAGLDPEGIQMVLGTIVNMNRERGKTILLCSHVLSQIEAICQRFVFIDGGRVLEQGTLAELEARYRQETLLEVETDLALTGDTYYGVPVQRLDLRRLLFRLPGQEAVPDLLRRLVPEAAVYGAQIRRRDLESLYFAVRRAAAGE